MSSRWLETPSHVTDNPGESLLVPVPFVSFAVMLCVPSLMPVVAMLYVPAAVAGPLPI